MASKKNLTTIKIDSDLNSDLSKLQREIQAIQNADVTKGEIVKRAIGDSNIQDLLRKGAAQRRLGLK